MNDEFSIKSGESIDKASATFNAPAKPKPIKLPTPQDGCGISMGKHNRVVGGNDSKPGVWPWIALIGYSNGTNPLNYRCSGSLITTKHVLTADHCMKSTL